MANQAYSIKPLLKNPVTGGLAGIGISLTFSMSTSQSLFWYPLFWIHSIFFGFVAGLFISAGNKLINNLFNRILPKKYRLLVIQLALSYLISVLIFYLITTLIKTTFYQIYGISSSFSLFSLSLGVGVISMIISFLSAYAKEKDEMSRLEKENRELAVVVERNRIARELHDSVSQNLFGISLHLNTLDYLLEQDPAKAPKTFKLLQEMVAEVQSEMRLMIYELRPAALTGKGFFEAIENMVNLFRIRYGLDIHSDLTGDENLDSQTQLVLYRILQESLNNIVKHSETFKVEITLQIKSGVSELTIQDNGKGFVTAAIDRNEHFGLKGMEERAAMSNGQFLVESTPGKGTMVRVII